MATAIITKQLHVGSFLLLSVYITSHQLLVLFANNKSK